MAEQAGVNGAKAFGGLMAIGLLGTFTWNLWRAQDSKVGSLGDLLNQRLGSLEALVNRPQDHPAVQTERIAALTERLIKLEAWREEWIRTVPALDATQNERIKALENKKPMP